MLTARYFQADFTSPEVGEENRICDSDLHGSGSTSQCPKCNKLIRTVKYMKRHMAHHTGSFSYFCGVCGKGFQASNRYNEHMMKHQGRKFHCDYCGKEYLTKEKLDHHQSVHTGIYKLHCRKCRKGFNVKRDCARHEKTCCI